MNTSIVCLTSIPKFTEVYEIFYLFWWIFPYQKLCIKYNIFVKVGKNIGGKWECLSLYNTEGKGKAVGVFGE